MRDTDTSRGPGELEDGPSEVQAPLLPTHSRPRQYTADSLSSQTRVCLSFRFLTGGGVFHELFFDVTSLETSPNFSLWQRNETWLSAPKFDSSAFLTHVV